MCLGFGENNEDDLQLSTWWRWLDLVILPEQVLWDHFFISAGMKTVRGWKMKNSATGGIFVVLQDDEADKIGSNSSFIESFSLQYHPRPYLYSFSCFVESGVGRSISTGRWRFGRRCSHCSAIGRGGFVTLTSGVNQVASGQVEPLYSGHVSLYGPRYMIWTYMDYSLWLLYPIYFARSGLMLLCSILGFSLRFYAGLLHAVATQTTC